VFTRDSSGELSFFSPSIFLLTFAHERVLSDCCTFSLWIEHHWLISISAGLFLHILSALACKFIWTVSLSVHHWTFMQMSFVHFFLLACGVNFFSHV